MEASHVTLTIPELSLVVLVGPSGSGKTTFARKHFKPTEILSSDFCRGIVADDENDQSATTTAFELLHFIVRKRLAAGRLTVIDATNVRPEDRKPLIELAREFHCLLVAVVLDLPTKLCQERNRERADRQFGAVVIARQQAILRRGLRRMKREGFTYMHKLSSQEEVDGAVIERTRLYNNLKHLRGPFDIIGDLHGCCDELEQLLAQLGYRMTERRDGFGLDSGPLFAHTDSRKVIFLGDLGDRGPRILDCFRVIYNMVQNGSALCLPGNHDIKLFRKLSGKDVQLTHGLAMTMAEINALPDNVRDSFRKQLADFIDSLISHYVLDEGKLVVAHAGMKEEFQGRGSGKVREFAMYGETTGETDEFGLPIRYNWAADYRGRAMVVYGHTPVPQTEWLNRTINIDTGCVFGGRLTAMRYPEREFIAVPAARTYFESVKPLRTVPAQSTSLSAQHEIDDLLDIADVIGKRVISTRLRSAVTIREENATAALEVMSRFAVNPKWLIYLPPTMSPAETSDQPDLLEHPTEAFAYYRRQRISRFVCEEKHMGSRAVVVVCRDEDVARRRFGIIDEGNGIIYTRTGRRFFNDASLEKQCLERITSALTTSSLWDTLNTDWVCLDCELMPWSAKAQELIRLQYAAVGAAAGTALPNVLNTLHMAAARDIDVAHLESEFKRKNESATKFVEAYRRYCWPVRSVADIKLAPFHILATEGSVHSERTHEWHMSMLAKLCAAAPDLLLATDWRLVDLNDPLSETNAINWWSEMTERGGEGMLVKPLNFTARGKNGLVQPAIKCRGREYLRIIYGPDYTCSDHLNRLKRRGLSQKRSLALTEFALGIEALDRFVRYEPLRRVHECVFGVLALESEPVDPRL